MFIFIFFSALESNFLGTFTQEEDEDGSGVHHPEIHGTGVAEVEGAVLVENTHWNSES